MAKERDWVDYTNLAANVDQAMKLGAIQSSMERMEDLEAEREGRAQEEAVRSERRICSGIAYSNSRKT